MAFLCDRSGWLATARLVLLRAVSVIAPIVLSACLAVLTTPCIDFVFEVQATGKPPMEYQWTVDDLTPGRTSMSAPLTTAWNANPVVDWPTLSRGDYRVTSRVRNQLSMDIAQFEMEILGTGECNVSPWVLLVIFSDGLESGTLDNWSGVEP